MEKEPEFEKKENKTEENLDTGKNIEEIDLLGKPLRLIHQTEPNSDPYNIPISTDSLYWGDTLIKVHSNMDPERPKRHLGEVFRFLDKEQIDPTEMNYSELLDKMDKNEEKIREEDSVIVENIFRKLDSKEVETLEKILPLKYLPKDSERIKEHNIKFKEMITAMKTAMKTEKE